MQEMLELEGDHISSATLSHLTDKGKDLKVTWWFLFWFYFLFLKIALSGEYWDHTMCGIHSLLTSIISIYILKQKALDSLQNLFHSGNHCDLKITGVNLWKPPQKSCFPTHLPSGQGSYGPKKWSDKSETSEFLCFWTNITVYVFVSHESHVIHTWSTTLAFGGVSQICDHRQDVFKWHPYWWTLPLCGF